MPQAAAPERQQLAFAEFYPRIHRYVRGIVRDPADADDAAQETFLRAHRERDALRDPEAALPWLYSIATRVSLDKLRARSRRLQRESALQPEARSQAEGRATAELRVEQAEMAACVEGYVEDLSDRYRAVLLLHDGHDLSCPEIAALLGESPGAVKIRLHRARARLRAALRSGCDFSYDERGALVCEPKT